MNKFIINEEEKKRILMMHQSATKRQYLKEQEENELTGNGVKVKFFRNSSRNEILNTGIISHIEQINDRFRMNVNFTDAPSTQSEGIWSSMSQQLYVDDNYYSFSEKITEKLNKLASEERLNTMPMKVITYQRGENKFFSVILVKNLIVSGDSVIFDYSGYKSEPQDNLETAQVDDDSISKFRKGKFSCNTKKVILSSYLGFDESSESEFSDELTNKMMGMCDEYAMNNKDKESDMA